MIPILKIDTTAAAAGATLRTDAEGQLWQEVPGGFVHDQEADIWHRGGHPDSDAYVLPICGAPVTAEGTCWFDECVVGCDLCEACEVVAIVRDAKAEALR